MIPIDDRVVIVVSNLVSRAVTLWISDGTQSGTGLLRHNLERQLIMPERERTVIENDGGLVFTAITEETGLELFRIRPVENLAAPENVVVHTHGTQLQLHWTDVSGAGQYEVEVRDAQDAELVVYSATVSDSNLDDIHLPLNRAWMVRVRSLALLGEDSPWSQPVEFVTGPKPVMKNMPAESTNLLPEFRWFSTPEISSFDVWLTHRDTKTRIAYLTGVTSKSFQVQSSLAFGQYAVWVRGIRIDGSKSDWSEVTEFTVVHPAIRLSSGGGISKTRRPQFTWQSVSSALTYRLEIRGANGSVAYAVSGISGTTHLVVQDLAAGRYQVVVMAMNAVRRISEQSPVTPLQIALAPQQLTNDAQSLSWGPVAGAVTYTVELIDAIGRLVIPRVTLTGTKFVASTPFAPGQYAFRVFANFPEVSSNWSANSQFEIFRPPVAILSPAGSTMDATLVIEWSAASGAEDYEIQVIQRGSGRTVYAALQKRSTVHRVASILTNGQYDLRVRALFSDESRSTWSSLVAIRVGPAVVLSLNSGVVQWQPVSAATHYELWINYLGKPPARRAVYLPYYT